VAQKETRHRRVEKFGLSALTVMIVFQPNVEIYGSSFAELYAFFGKVCVLYGQGMQPQGYLTIIGAD
jgi:hypothetical protein